VGGVVVAPWIALAFSVDGGEIIEGVAMDFSIGGKR